MVLDIQLVAPDPHSKLDILKQKFTSATTMDDEFLLPHDLVVFCVMCDARVCVATEKRDAPR